MHATIKEIAAKLGKEEAEVRNIRSTFSIKERGDAPKVAKKKGATAKLFDVEDVERAFQVISSFQQKD